MRVSAAVVETHPTSNGLQLTSIIRLYRLRRVIYGGLAGGLAALVLMSEC